MAAYNELDVTQQTVTKSKRSATQTSQQSEAMTACSTRFETGYCPSMDPNFAKTDFLGQTTNCAHTSDSQKSHTSPW